MSNYKYNTIGSEPASGHSGFLRRKDSHFASNQSLRSVQSPLGVPLAVATNEESFDGLHDLHDMHDTSPPLKHPTPPIKLLMVILAAMFTFLTSGVIFNFSPIEGILVKEKIYDEWCSAKTTTRPCPKQANEMNQIVVWALMAFCFCIYPSGVVLDRFGPRVSCLYGSVMFTLGALLFGYSQNDRDYFKIGYIMIALGSPPICYSFMHLSNLYPKRRGTILTIFNVMIDVSSLVFPIFAIMNNAGVQRETLFFGLGAVGVVIFFTSIVLWKDKAYEIPTDTTTQIDSGEQEFEDDGVDLPQDLLLGIDDTCSLQFVKQLQTVQFWLGVITVALHQFISNMFMAILYDKLHALVRSPDMFWPSSIPADSYEPTVEFWVSFIALMIPIVGILTIPVVGYLLDVRGLLLSSWALNILGLALSICDSLPSLYMQLPTVIIFGLYRALLFASGTTYMAKLFSFNSFGKLWGVTYLFSGIVAFFQMPAQKIAVTYGFAYIAHAQIALACALFVVPVALTLIAKKYAARSANHENAKLLG